MVSRLFNHVLVIHNLTTKINVKALAMDKMEQQRSKHLGNKVCEKLLYEKAHIHNYTNAE